MSEYYQAWMTIRDLPHAIEIERQSFTQPWGRHQFTSHLSTRNVVGMVTREIETYRVVAFSIYFVGPSYYELLNVAVHPEQRGQGIGNQIIARMIGKLNDRRPTLIAHVCENFLDFQTLLRTNGFLATAVDRRRFNKLDGYRFEFDHCFSSPARRSRKELNS